MRSPERGARRRCWTPARDRSDGEPFGAGRRPHRPWRPRDQPHDELDALAAGLADVVDVRPLAAGLGVGNHLVEPGVVPDLVDEAGARPAAGGSCRRCPRSARSGLRQTLDRGGGWPAPAGSSGGRRHRVLHDVDGEGNDREGPGAISRLSPQHGQRHGEAVVHVHLVDDGEVEVFLDDRLRDVRGQLGWPSTTGTGRGPQPSSAGA